MIKKIASIYDSLMDDESKSIFKYRMLYSMTGEAIYLEKMQLDLYEKCSINIMHNNAWKEFFGGLCGNTVITREVVIYGAGYYGRVMYRHITEAGGDVDFFCDRREDLWGGTCSDIPIISAENLINKHKDCILIIAVLGCEKEIFESLTELGFPAEQIVMSCGCQYFDDSVPLRKEIANVFVDGGCFDGMTAVEFANWNAQYKKIIAWEPERENQKKCLEVFKQKNIENVDLIAAGMWDKNDTLYIKVNESCSSISEEGQERICVRTLDEVCRQIDEQVGYIKMDIEGAELKALYGAEETIRKYKPQLAISIYHKPGDILDIPLYIKQLNPEYKFYLRHYTLMESETVLYAL